MGTLMRLLARRLDGKPADVAADWIAREEPPFGLVYWPPGAEDVEELWREHDIAIFLSFTLSDSDDHALTVDIGDLQADRLRDAQSRSVTGRQNGAMFEIPHARKKTQDLIRPQATRQLLRLLGRRNNF